MVQQLPLRHKNNSAITRTTIATVYHSDFLVAPLVALVAAPLLAKAAFDNRKVIIKAKSTSFHGVGIPGSY